MHAGRLDLALQATTSKKQGSLEETPNPRMDAQPVPTRFYRSLLRRIGSLVACFFGLSHQLAPRAMQAILGYSVIDVY